MALALKLGTDGQLQQLQDGDSLVADTFNRISSSGDLIVGGNLGAAEELTLVSTTAVVHVLGDAEFDGFLEFLDISAPGSTSDGSGRLYKKVGNDGLFWLPNSAGPEVDLTAAVASNEFADNLFRVQDDGDSSKELAFELSGVTTSTLRTITMPDANLTLLVMAGLVGGQSIVGGTASGEDLTLESTANATKGHVILATGTGLDLSDEDVINAKTITFETPGTDTSTSGVLNIDFGENQKRNHVLDENVTSVTFTAPKGPGNFMVRIEQASGVFSLPATVASWPAACEFVGDVAPVAPTAVDNAILLAVYYDGTTYYIQSSGVFNN